MNWAEKQHPLETVVEWVAPVPLGVAGGWAATMVGLSRVEAAAVGIALLTAGFAALKIAGRSGGHVLHKFEPALIEGSSGADLDELLLRAEDELLELTDPLVEPSSDSRVVRLFSRLEPTPGELVERITDFLGDGERPRLAANRTADVPPPVDASAALHAALANIRASLR